MNIRKMSIGLLFLILALVVVQGASAAHSSQMGYPSNNIEVANCQNCHASNGGPSCNSCGHIGSPTFSLSIVALPTSVPALSPTDVTLTVSQSNNVKNVKTPASGASVSLNGAGVVTSGMTDAAGIVTKTITPTGPGTIDVTATLTGFNDGATTVASNAAADTTAPVITMLGSSPIDVTQGTTYTDAGATALDQPGNVDLTASIVVTNLVDTTTLGQYTVTYNVVDAANNAAVPVVRTVNVIAPTADTTPPVINMLGSTPIDVVVGSVYVDAGATATDNVDGDLTSAIVTVNSVNTAIIGNYAVTYNVVDAAGNPAVEVVRTVNVVAASTANYYIVTFVVTDNVTGKPIKDAKVSIDGVKKETNRSGMVVFKKVSPGAHSYSIKAEHYKYINGTIDVSSDMTISVKLTPNKKHDDDDEDNGNDDGEHDGGHNKHQDKE